LVFSGDASPFLERYQSLYGIDETVSPAIPMNGILGWTGSAWEKISTVDGILASSATPLNSFATNDVSATVAYVTYIGKEKSDGDWCIIKIDETTGMELTYATIANNALITTYAAAWAARATLTYNAYSVAF
jgi:hypothetical protein